MMNLKESIRRILREQRDFSDLMVKLLNVAIIPRYENICKVDKVRMGQLEVKLV
jgi:rRNA pseudouridine-1189 N-methylase Emg1 (Nep1/Mra1 family)